MIAALAVLLGGALLCWPAALNGYPLLFSDTGAFLHQTLGPLMIWDKPWVYGPMLHAFHWKVTLWLPMLAQGVALSWLLWLAQRAVRGGVGLFTHLLLVALLAGLTAAPWFAALLMPDIWAPMVVLALYLLSGATLSVWEERGVLALGTLGIAAHLSHLPLAAALVVLLVLMGRSWRPLAPVLLAVLLVLVGNLVGHGRFALSPYGATFLLARLQADGPATRTLQQTCPAAGWTLCDARRRMPMDSDAFLWAPDSPVNRDSEGRARFLGGVQLAPEAKEILSRTVRREPLAVAGAMLGNGWAQLGMVAVGDTLVADHLAANVAPRIAQGFPGFEQRAYAAALQPRGALPGAAAPYLLPHPWVLWAGGAAALLAWGLLAWRGRQERLALVLCVLVGVSGNALATGALSGPHDRYQARIAWLLPLAALLAFAPAAKIREKTS